MPIMIVEKQSHAKKLKTADFKLNQGQAPRVRETTKLIITN